MLKRFIQLCRFIVIKCKLTTGSFAPHDTFIRRHIGPTDEDVEAMLKTIGAESIEDLVAKTIPDSIRYREPLKLGEPRGL